MDAFYVGLPRILVYLLLKGALVDKKDTEPALIDEFEAMGSVEFLNSLFRESNKTLPGACDYDSLINNQKIMQQKIDTIRSFLEKRK